MGTRWLMKIVLVQGLVVFLPEESSGFRRGLVLPPPEARRLDLEVDSQLFDQMLDHFNPTDNRTFQQRYFQENKYCKKGKSCPVFLMIGGESEISPVWMSYGSWIVYAKKYGAKMFYLEHRYYGLSQPTLNMSVSNLEQLNSEQALADIAYFINGMNSKHDLTKENKWILFGGSYAGSLVAWARMKYPHYVHGAVASSAPLKAQLDFPEYFQVVGDVLDESKKGCRKAVHDAFLQLQDKLNSSGGTQNLTKQFNVCSNFSRDNGNDVALLQQVFASPIFACVQYHNIQCNVSAVCEYMTNSSIPDPLQRLAMLNKAARPGYNDCLDIRYDDVITEYKQTDWNSSVAAGERQWHYQTCTEFGFYMTSNTTEDLFGRGIPLSSYIDMCRDIFGEQFSKKSLDSVVERSNIIYGARDIRVSRVLFTQGSVDPWHALGLTKTPYTQAPVIYIKGTAHCADMYSPSPDDPAQLKSAREQTDIFINTWLSQDEFSSLTSLLPSLIDPDATKVLAQKQQESKHRFHKQTI